MQNLSNLGAWAADLQPASWRGCVFQVTEATVIRKRRTVLHEYPNRDTVWVEDLGRGTRLYSFIGFIVGDDVFAQRDAILKANEVYGTGTLIHPSLGTLTVSLADFSSGERAERGRVVELSFEFIENAGVILFPAATVSTQQATSKNADNAISAVTSDFTGDLSAAGANV